MPNIFDLGNNLASPVSLYKEVSGDGNALLLSFKKIPEPSIILTPKAPAGLLVLKNAIDFSIQSSDKMVSGFKKRINSPLAAASAWLFALENPMLLLFQIKLIAGNTGSRNSLLPSVELLSATIISASIPIQAFCTEYRHCSRKYFTL